MDDVTLAKGAARALRGHIERRRRELADAILRACGDSAKTLPTGRAAFVGALLDRLDEELAAADPCETNAWVAKAAEGDPASDSILGLSLAMVAASYAAERPDGHLTARYLALRGRQLDRIFESAQAPRDVQLGVRVERNELVDALLASLEARDFATCDHSRAVGMWAQRIA